MHSELLSGSLYKYTAAAVLIVAVVAISMWRLGQLWRAASCELYIQYTDIQYTDSPFQYAKRVPSNRFQYAAYGERKRVINFC